MWKTGSFCEIYRRYRYMPWISIWTCRSPEIFLPPFSSLKSYSLIKLILLSRLVFIFLYLSLSFKVRQKWCCKLGISVTSPRGKSLKIAHILLFVYIYSLGSLCNSHDIMILCVFCLVPHPSVLHMYHYFTWMKRDQTTKLF